MATRTSAGPASRGLTSAATSTGASIARMSDLLPRSALGVGASTAVPASLLRTPELDFPQPEAANETSASAATLPTVTFIANGIVQRSRREP